MVQPWRLRRQPVGPSGLARSASERSFSHGRRPGTSLALLSCGSRNCGRSGGDVRSGGRPRHGRHRRWSRCGCAGCGESDRFVAPCHGVTRCCSRCWCDRTSVHDRSPQQRVAVAPAGRRSHGSGDLGPVGRSRAVLGRSCRSGCVRLGVLRAHDRALVGRAGVALRRQCAPVVCRLGRLGSRAGHRARHGAVRYA